MYFYVYDVTHFSSLRVSKCSAVIFDFLRRTKPGLSG